MIKNYVCDIITDYSISSAITMGETLCDALLMLYTYVIPMSGI